VSAHFLYNAVDTQSYTTQDILPNAWRLHRNRALTRVSFHCEDLKSPSNRVF